MKMDVGSRRDGLHLFDILWGMEYSILLGRSRLKRCLWIGQIREEGYMNVRGLELRRTIRDVKG